MTLKDPSASLSPKFVGSLNTLVRARIAEMKGQEMVYDLATAVQDALSELEREVSRGMSGSFYTAMMQRKEEDIKVSAICCDVIRFTVLTNFVTRRNGSSWRRNGADSSWPKKRNGTVWRPKIWTKGFKKN